MMNLNDPTFEQLVEIHNEKGVHVHQNLYEFCGWLNLCKRIKPKIYLEIGVFKVGSAQLAIELLPSLELFIALDRADLMQQERESQKIREYKEKLVFVQGDSADPKVMQRIADEYLKDRQVDAMFIDGDHSYNGVLKDYALYSPLVRRGGLIGFHDCRMANMPNPNPLQHQGSQSFWEGLEHCYPKQCQLIDVEPGPWGNYGIGVYTVTREKNK